MKRKITLIGSAFACFLLLAQSQMNFHFTSGSKESIELSSIDTIRFKNGQIIVEGTANKTYQVAGVDSATFDVEAESTHDTIFITYNGSNVTIDNPYSTVSVTADGANVTAVSSADIKNIVYYMSGTTTDGSFTLTPDRAFVLALDNLTLTSKTTAPITLNKAVNDSSYAATVNLIGASKIADSENNTLKGAIYTKSKFKVYNEKNGSLTVTGNYKHAINGAKHIELRGGTLTIDGAVGDGINADALEVKGGNLVISGTQGDGVDCSELIEIESGSVNITSAAEDAKGLKCDSVIEITGGTADIAVNGAGSKAIKSDVKTTVSGGTVTATLGATTAYVEESNGVSDYSYNAGLTSNGDIEISGTGKVIVKGAGLAGKGLNADGNININGGTFEANLSGAHNIEGSTDTTSAFGMKSDAAINIASGTVNITMDGDTSSVKYAKGMKGQSVYITGGTTTITNNTGYTYSLSGSSSSSSSTNRGMGGGGFGGNSSGTTSNSTTPKAIVGEQLVSITGGTLDLTCLHGKGITSDNSIVVGTKNGSDSDLSLTIVAGSSSDATYSKGGENDRTKYANTPKGMNCDKTIEINSGTIDIKAFDTGIKGSDVTVNGGKLTIDAQYDQGMHGIQTFTVNGGDIYVSNSYEAFEGVTITMNGGITSIYASNDGWNASTSSSGTGSPTIKVTGGYHYLNVGSGDTDCLDSNGSMTFSGGVVIVEGGSTLDGDQTGTYTGGKLMLFGSGVETSPSGATTTSGSAGSANTRYTAASSDGTVLSTFTTAKSSSTLYYLYSSSATLYSGGTYTAGTEVNFRWTNDSVLTYGEGGTISNGTQLSSSGSSSGNTGGPGSKGGFGF